MGMLTLGLVIQATLLAGPGDYSTAYHQSQADGKPILVLVGADWCPGCRTMKGSVMPRLARAGKLGSVHFAVVNSDAEGQLAGKLMRGGSIPQLIVFAKTADGWHREQITGATSDSAVEGLLRRAALAQERSPIPGTPRSSDAVGN